MRFTILVVLTTFLFNGFGAKAAEQAIEGLSGKRVIHSFTSDVLVNTKVAVSSERDVHVYLPPGYGKNGERYPVIYFLHSFLFDHPDKLFEEWKIVSLLDKAIQEKRIAPFILVMPDYRNSFIGSYFQNNPVSGRWLDFTALEVVEQIDQHFSTLARPGSRGLSGHFMGGRGALALTMLHPGIFDSVYALHPVGTGFGLTPMHQRFNWNNLLKATSYEDIEQDLFAQVFLGMAQAFAPNPDKPPFYADLMVKADNANGWLLDHHAFNRLRSGFLLDTWLAGRGQHLRQLSGLKIDWGRYDSNADHIVANQNFTRMLDEYAIGHSSEEYNGDQWQHIWTSDGRVVTDVLPFFAKHFKVNEPD